LGSIIKGQIIDQNNKPNPAVLFLLNTPGMNVQLRRTGFSYDVFAPKSPEGDFFSSFRGLRGKIEPPHQETTTSNDLIVNCQLSIINFHRIDFDFIATNLDCEIIARDPSSSYLNYYTTGTPEKGATMVHSYTSVTYRNIYKNIDLEFTLIPGQGFKYTFTIHPGGKLEAIRINISGAKEIQQSENGLIIQTSIADVEETIPYTYSLFNGIQTEIKSSFHQIKENLYGINVEQKIPQNSTLTIDPVPNRLWGTYFGGDPTNWTDDDLTASVIIDKAGNIIIAGYTSATNNIATAGSYQPVLNGGFYDAYLAKFTPDGVQIWGTYFGGENTDNFSGCITDSINNIFLTGMTSSLTNIATAGTFQPELDSLVDAFIAKFNPDGFRVWGTYYGGNCFDEGNSITLDPQCNIYISGETNSLNNIVSPGAYQTAYGGGDFDAFLTKFDSTGQRIWGTYYGGEDLDMGFHCSVDNNGHVLLCGHSKSLTDIASPGAHQTIYGGGGLMLFLPCLMRADNVNGEHIMGALRRKEATGA